MSLRLNRLASGNVDLTATAKHVHGAVLTETGGSAVVAWELRDGSAVGATQLTVRAPTGTTVVIPFSEFPWANFPSGLFVVKIGSGVAQGAIITS